MRLEDVKVGLIVYVRNVRSPSEPFRCIVTDVSTDEDEVFCGLEPADFKSITVYYPIANIFSSEREAVNNKEDI